MESPYEVGDTFLLFEYLSYDFRENLPLLIGQDVYLDHTPRSILNSAEPPAVADLVLPGYNLPGRRGSDVCLRYSSSGESPTAFRPTTLFFLALSSLRLQRPLQISIAGVFELSAGNQMTNVLSSFAMTSPWQPEGTSYSPGDIRASSKILDRQIEIAKFNNKRLDSALAFFSQVTTGFSRSFQMAYLALFAALDALFVPKGNLAKTLGRRVGQFLQHFSFPVPLAQWLENEYQTGRNQLAHGIQDVSPTSEMRGERLVAFGRLHEITRLSILGFLSFPDPELTSLSMLKSGGLQSDLDALGPATGQLIDGQEMRCS